MRFEKVAIGATRERVSFDGNYLARLRSGDQDTARHFNGYFRRLVHAKISGLFERNRGEDLMDKVMATVLERIFRGEPQDATRLVPYVYGICSNLTKTEMRPRLKLEQWTVFQDEIRDGTETVEETLMAEERAAAVKAVLGKLRKQDQAVLRDVFYFDLDREEICQKHHVTREQLRLMLFRARRRFQEEWGSGECR